MAEMAVKMEYGKLIPVTKEIFLLNEEKRVEQMTPLLLSWFSKHARILPWRENPLPYYVWISEIMLQQTRVEAVKPYFTRFLEALPDIKALAECEDERIMKLWEGLGYYSRARNLKKAAGIVVKEYGGELPADYQKLLKLPGIGSYTAGAIASIAYGIAVPAVDGNVLRVMARVLADRRDVLKPQVKRSVEGFLQKLMPDDRAGDFNQALMEIGATICLPNGEPKCKECPINKLCKAYMENVVMELPVKTAKKPRKIEEKTIFLIRMGKKAFLRKREEKGLLAGLYEFPNIQGKLSEEQASEFLQKQGIKIKDIRLLPEQKHIFSHVEWHMIGYEVWIGEDEKEQKERKEQEGGYFLVEVEAVRKEYAIPTAFSAYAKYLYADRAKKNREGEGLL